jgi:hypothetical protein
MSKLQNIFIFFLHIIVKCNPEEKLEKKFNHFLFILWWLGVYLYEKNTCPGVFKNTNIF